MHRSLLPLDMTDQTNVSNENHKKTRIKYKILFLKCEKGHPRALKGNWDLRG